MSERLREARAKVERAETQINEINDLVGAFLAASPYALKSQVNRDHSREIWRYELTAKAPVAIAIVAGEAMHNLRSALDHLACAVAELHSGSSKGTYFPFGADAQIFEKQLSDKAKKLPVDAQNMIRALKPYGGGNDLLWSLHDLNRRDKHIELAPIQVGILTDMTTLVVTTGRIDTIGPRTGRHLVRDRQTGNFVQFIEGHQPRISTEGTPHIILETLPGHEEDFEIMTGLPSTQFEADFQPTFNVAIKKDGFAKHQPIAAEIVQMRDLVQSIFLTFERRFFP